MEVNQQPRQVVQRNIIRRAVKNCLDVHTVDARAVDIDVDAEVLHLNNACVLGEVDLRLEIDKVHEVKVEDAHLQFKGTAGRLAGKHRWAQSRAFDDAYLRQPRRHVELSGGGVFVDERGEEPTLAAVEGAESVIKRHDLSRASCCHAHARNTLFR